LIINPKIQSINDNQQTHKAIIDRNFKAVMMLKWINGHNPLNRFLNSTHFSKSVFPQKMLRKKEELN